MAEARGLCKVSRKAIGDRPCVYCASYIASDKQSACEARRGVRAPKEYYFYWKAQGRRMHYVGALCGVVEAKLVTREPHGSIGGTMHPYLV
jgi:hypothetical protein